MDLYGKVVLTLIAVLLAVIAAGVWAPQMRQQSAAAGLPTVGDLMDLQDKPRELQIEMIKRIPLVRIQGSVDVD